MAFSRAIKRRLRACACVPNKTHVNEILRLRTAETCAAETNLHASRLERKERSGGGKLYKGHPSV